MTNYRFEKNARKNRRKALILTVLFHLALVGAVAFSGDNMIKEYVPDTVKEWFGDTQKDQMESVATVAKDDDSPRP